MRRMQDRREIRPGAVRLGAARRDRRSLLLSTALQAAFFVVIAVPAVAQPAPGARPTGGQVVGGAAVISSTTTNTQVTQSTQRGVIDWQKFDVGAQQSVTFAQPSTTSTTLNRVVGPDPSQIAGKITANGQIVISNQSGVLFYKGSVVDTAGLVATSANITNPNFMNGRMVFDRPGNPNARVVNEGTITARQAGLVGLVAPRVANSGVIDAKLGHVVLAGAPTATLDMYGDGMLSIDVTSKVAQVPVGPDGKRATALVTNTGTILAEGGSIRLTAAAADGIVSNLVDAGGRISARGGQIEIAGTGGSVLVDGDILANGRGAAGSGGRIAVNATDTVTIAKGARLQASGAAGGGTVAIGTTLARAGSGPSVAASATARNVWVQQGARISASAIGSGRGGTVTMLSTNKTQMDGAVAARGGKSGGDGGTVEISGATVGLTGTVDVSAAHGMLGTVLLDPVNVVIGPQASGAPAPGTADPNVPFDSTPGTGTITPQQLQNLNGNVHVEATNNLTVNSAVTLTGPQGGARNLTLEAGNNIAVNAPVSVTGSLYLYAASANSPARVAAGSILQTGTGNLSASGDITLSAPGGITLSTSVQAGSSGSPRTIALLGDTMTFGINTQLFAPNGTLVFAPVTPNRPVELINSGTANPAALSLNFNGLTSAVSAANTIVLGSTTAGPIKLGNPGDQLTVSNLGGEVGAVSTLGLISAGAVTEGGTLSVGTVFGSAASLALNTANVAGPQSTVVGNTFNISTYTTVGDLSVTTASDTTLGVVQAGGNATFNVAGSLTVNGALSGGTVTANSGVLTEGGIGSVTATLLTGSASSVDFLGTANAVGTIGDFASASSFLLNDTVALTVKGTINGLQGGNIALRTTVGSLALGASVLNGKSSSSLNTVNLSAAGPITQAISGTIVAGQLNASGTSISLPGTSNAFLYMTGATASTGDVSLTDSLRMTVLGAVSAGPVAAGVTHTVTLTTDQINISIFGPGEGTYSPSVTAPGGTIIIQPRSLATPVELIAGGTATPGALSVSAQDVGFITANTLQLGSAAAGAVTIGHTNDALDLSASVGTLNVLSGAGLSEGGSLRVGTLTGGVAGSANFNGIGNNGTVSTTNSITTLGSFSAPTGFALVNNGTLGVTGPVTANDTLSIYSVGDINLTGNLSSVGNITNQYNAVIQASGGNIAQNSGTLAAASALLIADGNITQSSSAVISTSGVLAAVAGGSQVSNLPLGGTQAGAMTSSVLLTSAINQIGHIGKLTTPVSQASGTFAVTSALGLTVDAVTAPTVQLNAAPGVSLNGPITATSLDVTSTAGNLIVGASALTVGTLTAAVGSATFDHGYNTISTLGAFSARGTIDLLADGPLAVTGPVTASGTGGPSINLGAVGTLTLAGSIAAPSVHLTSVFGIGAQGVTLPGNIVQTAGAVTTPSLTLTAGGAITQSGGSLTGGGLLTGSANGTVSLGGASNTIGTLGAFSSVGGFTLAAAGLAAQTGLVSDNTAITLNSTSGSLALSGTLQAPTVSLSSVGSLTEASGAAVKATTLTANSSGGSIDLSQPGNTATVLNAGTAASGFSLVDSSPTVTVAGTVTVGNGNAITIASDAPAFGPQGALRAPGGTVTLRPNTATSFSVGGGSGLGAAPPVTADTLVIGSPTTATATLAGAFNLSTVNTLDLVASTLATETGAGAVRVGAIAASAATITLNGANTITTLGVVNGGSAASPATLFSLTDSSSLAIVGPVNATAVTLNVTGTLTEPGTLSAGTLSGFASSTAQLTGSNTIGALGTFGSGGGITLTDSAPLAVTGFVSGSTVTLSSGGTLAIPGGISATGILKLSAPGAITEPGFITAGTLTGGGSTATFAGNSNSNNITNLGSFTTSTGFSLSDGVSLSITGAVNDGTLVTVSALGTLGLGANVSAPVVSLTAANVGTSLASNIIQTAGTVSGATAITLNAPGGSITQSGGAITGGTLSGTAAGTVSLAGTGNVVSGLGPFGSAGGFTLVDSLGSGATLTQTGLVHDTTRVSIAVGGGALALTGSLSATTVVLSAAGGIAQGAGVGLTATTLTAASSGGAIAFAGTANAVGTLGASSASGAFSLTDAQPLTISGTVTASGSAPSITLADDAPSFGPQGALIAAGGTVALGPYTSGALFTVGNGGTVGGSSNVTASVLTLGSAITGTLDVTGPLNLAGVTTLNLVSGGAVAETGSGSFSVGTLDASGTSIALGGPNTVATLATVTTVGGFALIDNAPTLTLAGPLTAATASINDGTGALQGTGAVNVGTLSGTAGSVSLTGANTIAALGTLSAVAGGLTLNDNSGLTIAGVASGSSVQIVTGGTLSIPGAISAAGGQVSLTVTGALTEPGTITAQNLVGNAISATLTGTNAIGTIGQGGSFTTANGFTLTDTTPLTVAGPVTGPGTGVTITVAGNLGVQSNISGPFVALAAGNAGSVPGNLSQTSGTIAGTSAITLFATGSITQSGTNAALTGGTLSGSAGGSVSLASALNGLSGLGPFTASGGSFTLIDTVAAGATFAQSGLLTAPQAGAAISISVANGLLALGGTINAPSVSLTAGAGITQSNASGITATTLAATGGSGAVALGNSTNAVGTLATSGGTGAFSFTDSVPVTIGGTVTANGPAPSITLADDAPSFAAQGALIASGGTVALGPFTAGALFTVGNGGTVGGASNVTANVLTLGSAITGTLDVTGPLNLTGVTTLNLVSGGAVIETGGGSFSVGTLDASGTAITLGGANTVASLSTIATAGAFSLTDNANLAITGPVNATSVTLNVTGTLTEPGTLSAGTLSGFASAGAQLTGSNTIATLGTFGSAGGVTLTDTAPLTVTGLVSGSTVTLSSGGTLAIPGGISAAGTVKLNAPGAITEPGFITAGTLTGGSTSAAFAGNNNIANLSSFTASGGFALSDGVSLSIVGPVSGTGVTVSALGTLGLSASVSGTTVSLTAANAGTSLASNIVQTAGTVSGTTAITLTAPGGSITQQGGAIIGGTLSGSAGGTVSLAGTANAVSGLGGFTSFGGFTLADALAPGATLTQTGLVRDTSSVSIAAGGGALALAGSLSAPSVVLSAAGAIAQGGTAGLDAGTLRVSSSGGAVVLSSTANTVGTLTTSSGVGAFSLTDAQPLTIAGTVTASGLAPSITLADDAPSFAAQGALVASGGTVALGPYSAGALFTVGNGGTVGGASNVTANVLTLGSAITGTLDVTGPLNLTGVTKLNLVSGGAVTETGNGAFSVGTLSANGTSVALGGANTVAVLAGGTASAGGFALNDTAPLTVGGPVSGAAAVSLASGGALTLSANVDGALVNLQGSDILQSAGTIGAGTLTARGSSLTLAQPGNQIATTGDMFINGAVAIVDGRGLTIVGVLDPTSVSLDVIGPLAINNAVLSTNATLIARGTLGAITEGANGGLSVDATLTGQAQSSTLDSNSNYVSTLGSFTTVGGFALANSDVLNVAGPVTDNTAVAISSFGTLTVAGRITAPTVSLTVAGYDYSYPPPDLTLNHFGVGGTTSGGDLLLTTGLVRATGAVTLTAGGIIAESGGAQINAGLLTGSAGGTASLVGTANSIATLGAFSSVGGLTLTDATSLRQTGLVIDTTSIGLTVAGSLSIGGTLQAPLVTLTTGAGLAEIAGGVVSAGTLTGSAGSDGVALAQANSIASLGNFSSGGDFALGDTAPVLISGTVSAAGTAPHLTITDDQPCFCAGGQLIAINGTVTLAPFTSGATLTVGGGTSIGSNPAVRANTLVLGSTTAGGLVIANTLDATGATTLDLVSGGTITEGGTGVIAAGVLIGTAGGGFKLDGANQIGTLGALSASGGFNLNISDAIPVLVTGSLASPGAQVLIHADTITLAAGASFNVGSAAVTSASGLNNAVFLAPYASGDAITLAGGTAVGAPSIASAPLVSIGSYVDTNLGTILASNATITGAFNLGAATVRLTASGNVIETGAGAIGAATLTSGGANLAQFGSGSVSLTGINAIANLGPYTSRSGFVFNNSVSLAVVGAVSDLNLISISTPGGISIQSSLSAPSVLLSAGGQIVQTGGTLATVTLTGSAVGLAQFGSVGGNAVAQIGTLAGFTVSNPATGNIGVLNLADSTALTVSGTLSAAQFAISAPSSITLNATTISTDAVTAATARAEAVATTGPQSTTGPQGSTVSTVSTGPQAATTTQGTSRGGSFQVLPGSNGTGTFTQLGTTVVTGLDGPTSSLSIAVPNGGSIGLANLVGPNTALTLVVGSGARAAGTINAGGLLVVGQGGTTSLFGSVGTLTGFAAAQGSAISPAVDQNYQLNNCAIEAISCTTQVTNTTQPPPIQPYQTTEPISTILYSLDPSLIAELAPKSFVRTSFLINLGLLTLAISPNPNDPDLLLPNISAQDY